MNHFVEQFGENIFKYFVVLFTRKDDLDEDSVTLLDHIENCPADLRIFIQKCGGRVFAINNREKNQEEKDKQVNELFKGILTNVEKNGGTCYTHKMYEDAEKILQKVEEEKILRRKEELKRELQKMEKQLSEKYEKKIEETEQKVHNLQEELSDVYKKQKESEEQAKYYARKVKFLRFQLRESKEDDIEQIKATLNDLTLKYEERKAAAEQGAIAIERFEKYSRKLDRDRQEYLKIDKEEKENMQRKLKLLEEERSQIRDELRKELEFTQKADRSCTIL